MCLDSQGRMKEYGTVRTERDGDWFSYAQIPDGTPIEFIDSEGNRTAYSHLRVELFGFQILEEFGPNQQVGHHVTVWSRLLLGASVLVGANVGFLIGYTARALTWLTPATATLEITAS